MCSVLSDADFIFIEKSIIKATVTEKHRGKPSCSVSEANQRCGHVAMCCFCE